MSKFYVLYTDEKYGEEESLLKSSGIRTFRADTYTQFTDLPTDKHFIMRGAKPSKPDYTLMYRFFQSQGITLVSSPKSYEIASSAKLNGELLGKNAPRVYTFPSTTANAIIIRDLNEAHAITPLFVRSEKESAAKYVGVDGCIVKSNSFTEYQTAIDNLRKSVSRFNEIIFKQLLPIKNTATGAKLEYRAIIVEGQVISFDYSTDLPDPKTLGLGKFVASVSRDLYEKGFDGGFFMDFAVKEDGNFFVVECKDLINGTIKDIKKFVDGLLDD